MRVTPPYLSTHDLDLYSHCPRLYKYYKDNNISSVKFQDHMGPLIEKVCTWMYSYLMASGNPPSVDQLDNTWVRNIPLDMDEKVAQHTLIQLRHHMLNELYDHLPAYTNWSVRHPHNSSILQSHIPVISEFKDKPTALFFKTFNSTYYRNDIHIRLIGHKLRELVDAHYLIIYQFNPNKLTTTKHKLYIADLSNEQFYVQLQGLMDGCSKGPYTPVFRCTNRSCPHWADCTIGK